MTRFLALLAIMAAPALVRGQSAPDGDPLPKGAVARLGTTRFRHGTGLSFLSYLPDGKLMTAGILWDQSIRVWDSEGREVRRFEVSGPKAPAEGFGQRMRPAPFQNAMAVSVDGQLLAVCSWGGLVRFWEVASGKELRSLEVEWEALPVEGLAISNDKKLVALARSNGLTTVWDIANRKRILTIGDPKSKEFDLRKENLPRFADGDRLVVTEIDQAAGPNSIRRLKAFELATGKVAYDIPASRRSEVAFTLDGRKMAFMTDGDHYLPTVVETRSGKIVSQAPAGEGEITALAWSHDGRFLAVAASLPDSFRIWDVVKGKEVREVKRTALKGGWTFDYPHLMAFSPDGKKLAWATFGQLPQFLNVESGVLLSDDMAPVGVRAVSFLPDNKTVLSRNSNHVIGECRWWEMSSRKVVRAIFPKSLWDLVSPDGAWQVAIEQNKQFKLASLKSMEVETGKVFGSIDFSERDVVLGMRMSGNGRALAIIRSDFEVCQMHLYDLPSLKKRCAIPMAWHSPWIVALSGDGSRFAAYRGNQQLGIFSGETGKLLQVCDLANDTYKLFHGAFSADNRTIALEMDDGRVMVWETQTGKARAVFGQKEKYEADSRIPARSVPGEIFGYLRPLQGTCVEFSPDCRLLAWGRVDGSVEVYDLIAGKSIATLKGHEMRVNTVAFSPDGAYLASGSSDTTVVVWKTPRGR